MLLSIESYIRRGRRLLRHWAVDPRFHGAARGVLYILAGFAFSAAALAHRPVPLALSLVCACSGWPAVLTALGGALGHLVFWGIQAQQGFVWLGAGLLCALLLGSRRTTGDMPLLIPAISGLIVAASGVFFQAFAGDTTPILLHLVRVGLSMGATWLFTRVLQGREPILDWLAWGLGVLALAQIVPIPYLGLGFFAAGAITVVGAFPAAAMAGLALDLAQVTPVPMTAVLCMAYLVRLFPKYSPALSRLAPGCVCLLVMGLCGAWDLAPLPALFLGGIAGGFLPTPAGTNHRRGETGMAQVRLEMAAGVLAQSERLLAEVTPPGVDEDVLVTRAAERACGSCPCRKNCRDSSRIAQLPAPLLHKPLLTPEELPIICRKSGRFLAELHRSQEQLRSIRADRERQKEYRAAVSQQYLFLSTYLQELSDQLVRRGNPDGAAYEPQVQFFGNRPEGDNGDRCAKFSGVGCKYYVLLCDGMGTGLGAVHEGRTAGTILRRLLSAGYPAEHALRSLNSLCALRERAGAVTVDLLELQLDTGKGAVYKWGAAPSFLISRVGTEKLGVATPPPGLSVTDCRETVDRFTMRRGELFLMVSDGVDQDHAQRCCSEEGEQTPQELASKLLSVSQLMGQDDATVITVRLMTGQL